MRKSAKGRCYYPLTFTEHSSCPLPFWGLKNFWSRMEMKQNHLGVSKISKSKALQVIGKEEFKKA